MKPWLREVLDEATRNVSRWPEWRRYPEMTGVPFPTTISTDPDLSERSRECVTRPEQESDE